MTKEVKFEKYEEKQAQAAEVMQKMQARAALVDEARAELAAAKAEHKALVSRYADDLTLGPDIDKADVKVSEASKKLARLQSAQAVEQAQTIGLDELKKGWNEQYMPEYYAQEIQPHLDGLVEAKAAYVKHLAGLKSAMQTADQLRDEVAGSINKQFPYVFNMPVIDRNKYFLKDRESGFYDKF